MKMNRFLVVVCLLTAISAAILPKHNNNHQQKLNQFERYLSSQPRSSRECFKQLLCVTWKNQTAQDNIIPFDQLKVSLDEMVREYDSVSVKHQADLGLMKAFYDEYHLLNTNSNDLPDCYQAFPDCMLNQQDLTWFHILQTITVDMLVAPNSEFRNTIEIVGRLISNRSQPRNTPHTLGKLIARRSEGMTPVKAWRRPKRQVDCAATCTAITTALCSVTNVTCSLIEVFAISLSTTCQQISTPICLISGLICLPVVNIAMLS